MRSTLSLLTLASALWASGTPQADLPPLQFELKPMAGGETLQVKIPIPHGWHLTSHAPKNDFQIPLVARISAPQMQFGPVIYPEPVLRPLPALGIDGSWFEDSLILKFPLASAQGTWSRTQVALDFQACTETYCIAPRTDSMQFEPNQLQAAFGTPQTHQKTQATPVLQTQNPETQSAALLLFFAFVGGMILNLMPCVLPVLGLKVFGLVQKSASSSRAIRMHALAFVAGTLVSFWALAGIMIALKHGGQAVGWGFQFQEPGFVLALALIVGLFAANMLGLFEIRLGWKATTKMDQATRKEGWAGAFWSGAFMTLLATPCTAPMLSPAMAFAFSASDAVLVLFMSAAGLGLAAPYAALCLIPALRTRFPKPGPWMIRFKELMGFLLVLTLVWLLYTFGQMSGNYALSMLLLLFTAWGMAFWAWGWLPWTSITAAKIWPKNLTALILFALSVWFVQHQLWPAMQEHDAQQLAKQSAPETQNLAELPPEKLYKKGFDPELIRQLNAQGHDVFVDFTADWCISCHANEKVALEPQEVDQYFRAGKPIFLIGDYTRKDPRITAELKKFGRSGVPMYVLYKANGQTVVLPETLTPQIVLDAIQ